MHKSNWWRWAIGIGLLFLIAVLVGPHELVNNLRRASLSWVLFVAAASAAWLVLGGVNVWILLRRLSPVRLRDFLRVYTASWSASLVLPGQLGDATQIWLLREHGVPMASSSAAYLLDKSVSLSWLVLVAAYGIARYVPGQDARLPLALLALAALAGLGFVTMVRGTTASHDSRLGRLRRPLDRVVEQLLVFRKHAPTVAQNVSLTVLKWLLMAVTFLGCFRAFGTTIGFEAAATIPVMASLVGYIPVTMGGAGTAELTAVVLFAQLGHEASTVFSVYLLLRGVLIITAFLLLFATRQPRLEGVRAKLGDIGTRPRGGD